MNHLLSSPPPCLSTIAYPTNSSLAREARAHDGLPPSRVRLQLLQNATSKPIGARSPSSPSLLFLFLFTTWQHNVLHHVIFFLYDKGYADYNNQRYSKHKYSILRTRILRISLVVTLSINNDGLRRLLATRI